MLTTSTLTSGSTSRPATKVAMFVLNPCHSDARVRKEAAALGRAGYDVRIFALGNSTWPTALVQEGDFAIQRLQVVSVYQRILGRRARRKTLRPIRADRSLPKGPLRVVLWPVLALFGSITDFVEARWFKRVAERMRVLARRSVLKLRASATSRLSFLHRPSVYRQFWKVAAAAALQWGPDVVHAHDFNSLPAAYRVSRIRGAKLVYDSHELWRHRNRMGRRAPIGRLFDRLGERFLIRHADLVITVSPNIASWLDETYGLDPPTVVVRNVPDKATAMPAPSLRELAGLGDHRILIYTGRITLGRGLEEAIDALALLPSDLVLVMLGYGDGAYIDLLFKRARGLQVSSRLLLVSPVESDQVVTMAAQADLALVAIEPTCLSYVYCLPNKFFEAIQAGIPLVVSDLPDMAALVRRYGLGEVFASGDTRALADAVQRILDQPDPYRSGAFAAGEDLTWETEKLLLTEAYRALKRPQLPLLVRSA